MRRWLLVIAVMSLTGIGCTHRHLTIYDPAQCVDVDAQGHAYPINTHVPVVKRICRGHE